MIPISNLRKGNLRNIQKHLPNLSNKVLLNYKSKTRNKFSVIINMLLRFMVNIIIIMVILVFSWLFRFPVERMGFQDMKKHSWFLSNKVLK